MSNFVEVPVTDPAIAARTIAVALHEAVSYLTQAEALFGAGNIEGAFERVGHGQQWIDRAFSERHLAEPWD